MVTHTYPPVFTSGTLRTLNFSINLSKLGWRCKILTTRNKGMNYNDPVLMNRVPFGIDVKRLSYIDGKSDLAFQGRHFAFTNYPDHYASWIVMALLWAKINICQNDIDVIYSTYPIPSSHMLGYALSRLLKKPWVADFRDPMVQTDYPADKNLRRIWKWIEKRVIANASHLIFTTESARELYLKRYQYLHKDRCHIISNGYNESDFIDMPLPSKNQKNKVRIIHAGLVYPWERDPRPLFKGLRLLLDRKTVKSSDIQIDFYGSGTESAVSKFREIVDSLNLTPNVNFLPRLSHQKMLQEMVESDALLIIQAACCDAQIPAKIYEYFCIGKPIIALTTETGETGRLIKKTRSGIIAQGDKPLAIADVFEDVVQCVRKNKFLPTISKEKLEYFSRTNQAKKLSKILEAC